MPEIRLIDANKLLKKCIEGDGDDKFTEGYNFAVQEISAYIELAPTIEPERKKGHINIYNGFEHCSECGKCLCIGYTNYCGYCGAELEVSEDAPD